MYTLKPVGDTKLLHHRAQEAIREYVIGNNLGPGDPLPAETELARRLGIGRNSVREAIRALETLGVLEVRRGRGAFVREFSFEPLLEGLSYGLMFELRQVEELLDIRCVLETGMIASAMETLDDEALAELRLSVDRMGVCVREQRELEEEDRAFHVLAFSSIGNETLLRLLDVFWMAYHTAARHLGADPDPERTWQEHLAILEAIEAGDADRAGRALEAHYAGIKQRLAAARGGAEAT